MIGSCVVSPGPTIPVPDGEVAGVLAVILRNGAGGTITQEAACFMATICAEHLVDQLGLAGYVVVRHDQLAETLGPLFGR